VFSLGGSEILIVAVVAFLLFGPDKIPQFARTIGRFTREFTKYKDIMESTIRMEVSRAEGGPTPDELTIEERIAKAGAAGQALLAAESAKRDAASATGAEPADGTAPSAGTEPIASASAVSPPATLADKAEEAGDG
jgi:sec-independent protein translocase protein TatB